jgi:hypothetical protein
MRGITYACLLNLFLTFFYWRVWVLTENSGESFIPTVIITLPVLIVIALCIRRLASPAQPPATSFIYWFAGAILLAAMAYPAGSSIYSGFFAVHIAGGSSTDSEIGVVAPAK